MTPPLNLWWNRQLAATLSSAADGLHFQYAQAFLEQSDAAPVSASLPKRPQAFSPSECRAFFEALLPAAGAREAAARALGIPSGDTLALLARLGGDTAGGFEFLPPDQTPQEMLPGAPAAALSSQALLELLDSLEENPLAASHPEMRLCLPGARIKTPILLASGALALPRSGQFTTHLIKTEDRDTPASIETEAFLMRLAGAAGLEVAAAEARVLEGRTYMVARRFDRFLDEKGRLCRLHQEDFLQALGRPPSPNGAALAAADCFALLRRVCTRPALGVLALLDAIIFGVITGQAPAQAPNLSLLYLADGPRLAPLYGLSSAASPQFAFKIGRQPSLETLNSSAWSAFAKEGGLGEPLVRRRVADLSEAVHASALPVAEALSKPGFDSDALQDLAQFVQERAETVSASLGRR